jgi:hypothetical protein
MFIRLSRRQGERNILGRVIFDSYLQQAVCIGLTGPGLFIVCGILEFSVSHRFFPAVKKVYRELLSAVGGDIRDLDLGAVNHGKRSPLQDLLIETRFFKIKNAPMPGREPEEQNGF